MPLSIDKEDSSLHIIKFAKQCQTILRMPPKRDSGVITQVVRPVSSNTRLLLLELGNKFLPEFGNLRCDYRRAVWLVRIVGKILLMIVLGRIEITVRRYFGHYRIVVDCFGCYFGYHLFRNPLLLIGIVKDRGAVGGADVVALAVKCRRVMYGEIHLQQLFE